MLSKMTEKNKTDKYKPAVAKKVLFFVAGSLWLIGGAVLLIRGIMVLEMHDHLLCEISIGIVGGFLFYGLLFRHIPQKHIKRIKQISNEKPCLFAFFDVKSYLLMAVMISGGIIIKKLQVVDEEYYFTFLIAMGIPLVLSAFQFIISGFCFKSQQ